jgi:hypothetical protein
MTRLLSHAGDMASSIARASSRAEVTSCTVIKEPDVGIRSTVIKALSEYLGSWSDDSMASDACVGEKYGTSSTWY